MRQQSKVRNEKSIQLGSLLRGARKNKGASLKKIAETEFLVSSAYLSYVENGYCLPGDVLCHEFARVYSLSYDVLIKMVKEARSARNLVC
ncbi:MAG: hypothetical protein G01um101466_672 [Parcubacteria group bacterium Gr01-1014_66]|nr:MAG: hypothetical protein G01um101466_672 [Parcubacteria group bacterium Gr01-1014_66]